MKLLLSFLFCTALFFSTNGQKSSVEAIRQGDEALKKGAYETAIKYYYAAEAFDPSKKDVVKVKVNMVFERMNAVLAKHKAEALKQKQRADSCCRRRFN